MARGGYRKPAKPAPASGPGRLSRRTDGGPGQPVRALSDAAYGEQKTYREDQAGAPLASAPGAAQTPAGPLADLSRLVPFEAPTQRPGEPVTAGAATGPGPGLDSLGLDQANDPGIRYMREMLPMLEIAAMLPTSSFEFRQYVRRLRGSS